MYKEDILRLLVWLSVIAAVIFGISSCQNTEWYKESQRRDAAQKAADAQPRVIREVDGCKVYSFKNDEGRWVSFTRCSTQTTTVTPYNVNCGKNCVREERDVIETR